MKWVKINIEDQPQSIVDSGEISEEEKAAGWIALPLELDDVKVVSQSEDHIDIGMQSSFDYMHGNYYRYNEEIKDFEFIPDVQNLADKAAELDKIAAQVGEENDPFAAWEKIAAMQERFRIAGITPNNKPAPPEPTIVQKGGMPRFGL